MLQKKKEVDVEIENPIRLESWAALQAIPSNGAFSIVSAIYTKEKTVLVNVKNKSNFEIQIDVNLLNIENMYQLYGQLSSVLTTVTPAYNLDSLDEI